MIYIRRANLKKYLKDSDETAGKVRMGYALNVKRMEVIGWHVVKRNIMSIHPVKHH